MEIQPVQIVPMLKEYLEIMQNDEQLVKLSNYRTEVTKERKGDSEGEFGLTEKEKEQLCQIFNRRLKSYKTIVIKLHQDIQRIKSV